MHIILTGKRCTNKLPILNNAIWSCSCHKCAKKYFYSSQTLHVYYYIMAISDALQTSGCRLWRGTDIKSVSRRLAARRLKSWWCFFRNNIYQQHFTVNCTRPKTFRPKYNTNIISPNYFIKLESFSIFTLIFRSSAFL